MAEPAWNPRYVAYAHAHARDPAAMQAHDAEAWPGGRACGFILWISAQWARWFLEVKGYKRPEPASKNYPPYLSDADHHHFTTWLLAQYQWPRLFHPTETP